MKRCPRGYDTKSTWKVVDENVAGPTPGKLEYESCLRPCPVRKSDPIKLIQRVHIGLLRIFTFNCLFSFMELTMKLLFCGGGAKHFFHSQQECFGNAVQNTLQGCLYFQAPGNL